MINMYDLSPYVAEIYDTIENDTNDVKWLLTKLAELKCKNVFEAYCGTGRILIPIAKAGFSIVGVDSSGQMLQRLHNKLETKDCCGLQIAIHTSDFLNYCGKDTYDAVLLMGNCLYTHGHSTEQFSAIKKAASIVKTNGYVFLENDVHEKLPESWGEIGKTMNAFPTGKCGDGSELKGTELTVAIDKIGRFWRGLRIMEVSRNGKIIEKFEWIHETHGLSILETETMIKAAGLTILGSWSGTSNLLPITPESKVATYITQKK